MTVTIVILFLLRHATPIAIFLLSLLPTVLVLLLSPKGSAPTKLPYRWALIAIAAAFAYFGSIGPFNMLLGSYAYQHSIAARINELGCWIYYPMRALPISARDLLSETYVSGWLNYGLYFANSADHELHQVPSIPTQLYR